MNQIGQRAHAKARVMQQHHPRPVPLCRVGVVVTRFCDKSLVLSPCPCLVPPPMPRTDLHLLRRDSLGRFYRLPGCSQGGPGGNHHALWDRGSVRLECVCLLLGCGCVRSSRGLFFQVLGWLGADKSWPCEWEEGLGEIPLVCPSPTDEV